MNVCGSATAIPLAAPNLSGNEEAYVVAALRSNWISSAGDYVERFEDRFADYCGTRAAISVSNGTAALSLLLKGLNIGPGDEVIVPTLTFVATANAVRHAGARPVFADIDPANWCLDPGALEALVTPRTKGIIAVHLYGHPADMDAINGLASRFGLWTIEDAAQAHGARYKGRAAGALATAATFSFYGNKIVTCGEGGAIAIDDPVLESRLRALRGHGVDPGRRYHFTEIGYNFRLSNLSCAVLCAQMEHVESDLRRRRQIFDRYRARLSGVHGIGFQPKADWAEPAPWLFCITVDAAQFGINRDQLIDRLGAEGIETRPFFVPVHALPPYADSNAGRLDAFPLAAHLAARGLCLPTFAGLTDANLDRVADAVRRAA